MGARSFIQSARRLFHVAQKPNWEETARKLTGGAGVDHIVEVGGSDTMPRSLRAIRTGERPRASGTVGLEIVRMLAQAQEALEMQERQYASMAVAG